MTTKHPKSPQILLTNDDGIDAPGMQALEAFASERFGPDARILVVAPDRGRSECGHGVENAQPLTLQQRGRDRFALSGTPVNCVRVALHDLMPHPDWVLSGINQGANLGVDVLVSGTVAAAREAALHGVQAVAISHYRHPNVPRTWEHVGQWLGPVFDSVVRASQRTAASRPAPVWNINLPALDPNARDVSWVECPVDPTPIPIQTHRDGHELGWSMDFHGRPRIAASDVDRCFGGQITLSRLDHHLS